MTGEWQEYHSWEPLFEIADMIPGITYKQLSEWEKRRKTNGFPEPKQVQGRHRFYDPEEIKRWVHLHLKVTKNMIGNGQRLNDGTRTDS